MRRSVSATGGLDAPPLSPQTIGVASAPCRRASGGPRRRRLLPSPETPCRRPSGPRPRPSAWAGTRRSTNLRSTEVFVLQFPLTPCVRRCYSVKRITSGDYIDVRTTQCDREYFVGTRHRTPASP